MPGFLNSIIADAKPQTMPIVDGQVRDGGLNSSQENLSYTRTEERPEQNSHQKNNRRLEAGNSQPMPVMTGQTNTSMPATISTPQNQTTPQRKSTKMDDMLSGDTDTKVPPETAMRDSVAGTTELVSRHKQAAPSKPGPNQRTIKTKQLPQKPHAASIKNDVLAETSLQPNTGLDADLPVREIKAKPSKISTANVEHGQPAQGDTRPALAKMEDTIINELIDDSLMSADQGALHKAPDETQQHTDQAFGQTIKSFEINKQVMLQEANLAKAENLARPAEATVEPMLADDYAYVQQEPFESKGDKASTANESAPRVHIGQIDIIVQSDSGNTSPRQIEQPTRTDFSSRHYLRRLL